jgi:dihydrodipicolinate synthase/N-acetylneuraminate lyase
MYKEIPTFRQVKDEAGNTLARITEIRNRTNDGVKVFTGNGVRNMINELMLGAQGYCPYTDLADIYAQAFDLWSAGKRSESFDMFGRVLCFNSVIQSIGAPQKYILVARGVFKNTRRRGGSGGDATAGRAAGRAPERLFTAEGEKLVRSALDLLKPYLRA